MSQSGSPFDESSVVRRSHPRPGVTLLEMNRPERLNAMTAELVESLHRHLDEIAVDPEVRVVVLTGVGRGFCAGLDITGYGEAPHTAHLGPTQKGLAVQKHIASLIPHLRSLPQPVISAVNGPAAGGGFALVLGSDVRLAATSARFSAAEAARIGLVLEPVPAEDLLEVAYAKADQIMENAPFAVTLTKEGMWSALEIPGMQAAIDLENRQQIMATATSDHREAMRAFVERRPPEFQNR